ncbi:MAG TPA: PspC domain-containing protein [Vicinamibacteria bacterium]|nr:PspC domain-containing protein [Vicinamibacteria bacterium]
MTRRLTRDTQRGVFGGVAAGFGEYLDVDPVLVRLGFVLLAFVHGLGLLFYAACWVVVPRRDRVVAPAGEPSAPASPPVVASPDAAAAQLAVGTLLVIAGGLLLAHNLDWLRWPWWMRFETLWPLLLVALGLGLVAKSRRVPLG